MDRKSDHSCVPSENGCMATVWDRVCCVGQGLLLLRVLNLGLPWVANLPIMLLYLNYILQRIENKDRGEPLLLLIFTVALFLTPEDENDSNIQEVNE